MKLGLGKSILVDMFVAHPIIMAILLIVLGAIALIFIKYILAIIMVVFMLAAIIFAIIGIRKTNAPIPIEWKAILVVGITVTLVLAAFSVNKMVGIEWTGDVPGDGWSCSVTNVHPVDWEEATAPPVFTATIDTDCPNAYVSFEYSTDIGYFVSSSEAGGYTYVGDGIHTVTYSPADYGHTSDEFTTGAVYKWTIVVWNYNNTSGQGAAIWQKDQLPGSYNDYWYYRIGEGGNGGTHTLTVTSSPPEGGNVSLNPAGGIYDAGQNVTLVAIANPGWKFDHWGGAIIDTHSTVTITMPAQDVNVTAYFVRETSYIWYLAGSGILISLGFIATVLIYRRRKK